MQIDDIKDLIEAIERQRKRLHPDLNPVFVSAVLRAEMENPEDDEQAIRGITVALEKSLAKGGKK